MEIMNIPSDKWRKLDSDKVMFIVIHHTACEKATPMQIHSWHNKRGFHGFGYNAYIRKNGKIYIGRGFHVGAHAKGYNSTSYGICVEGNYSVEKEMPPAQMRALKKYVRDISSAFPNLKEIVGHNIVGNTECPGTYFPWDEFMDNEEPHWANNVYNELTEKFGVLIHEKRFDDKITRGEAMALLLQGLKTMKEYIDHH